MARRRRTAAQVSAGGFGGGSRGGGAEGEGRGVAVNGAGVLQNKFTGRSADELARRAAEERSPTGTGRTQRASQWCARHAETALGHAGRQRLHT